ELDRWGKDLAEPEADKAQASRKRTSYLSLRREVPQVRKDLQELARAIDRAAAELTEAGRTAGWERLQRYTRQLLAAAGQTSIVQTQVRVHLIKLEPLP